MSEPASSSCRNTRPTSTPLSRSSPSSKLCCERPGREATGDLRRLRQNPRPVPARRMRRIPQERRIRVDPKAGRSSKHRAHGIPVTVRIQAVVLGPNTGGQGPNTSPDLARTGSDGVAEVHKRQAAARVCAAFSSRSTARAFASVEARLFPRIHRSGPLVRLDRRRPQNRLSVRKMEASPSFTEPHHDTPPTGPWRRRIRLRRYRRTGRRAQGTPRSEGAAS
jgi:hypothetical protein